MSGAGSAASATRSGRRLVRRHSVLVRVTHWVNVVCLTVLLMSGLQIFNAHPALYWGQQSDFGHPLLAMTAEEPARGVTTLFGHRFITTGVLGVSNDASGQPVARGFPGWITLPGWQSLAEGRLWHFFFAWLLVANGAVYVLAGVISVHFWRDLVPRRGEWRLIGRTLRDHARLRFPHGEEARAYNVLQKLAYLGVVAIVLPVIVLAGLAMSPRLDAAFPSLLALFDGRQSARTVHFIAALLLVGFVLVHVVMVVLSGAWNNLRSMVTGRYAIEDDGHGR